MSHLWLRTSLLVQPSGRCFRNPVLLGSDGNHKVRVRGQRNRANEDANNLIQAQKHRDGREYITERQSFFCQSLHGRSSDFTAKLQRTVKSEEVVMAA